MPTEQVNLAMFGPIVGQAVQDALASGEAESSRGAQHGISPEPTWPGARNADSGASGSESPCAVMVAA